MIINLTPPISLSTPLSFSLVSCRGDVHTQSWYEDDEDQCVGSQGCDISSSRRSPDLQEVGLAHAASDEVISHLAAALGALPQEDEVRLDLLAQGLHRGHRRLHVALVQPVLTSV